ncbi:MAG TPA: maleylpyruvate isomerase N-terminal domain-containing protein, partial [Actinomycetota bacterium]|nr:maleylpyruvate isomerase N-terminal domain-containing protein [Actinomycetota bacterium]
MVVGRRDLDHVHAGQLDDGTPCADWSVGALVDHLVAAPANFAHMIRGEEVDWSAPTPHVGGERADAFRANADDLMAAWRDVGDG